MDSSHRRRFLQTVAGVSTIGLAGCSLFSSEQPGENEEEPPEITDTPANTPTATPTPAPVPDDASFEFDYSGGSLTIRFTGGGPIPASNLVVRSSDGTQVRWHELGSTAVPASGNVTSGDTATIDSSVLNWPNAVEQSETIRVVFVAEGGSPTTLGMFEPSAEETPTETETPTNGEELVIDDFESGSLDAEWTNEVGTFGTGSDGGRDAYHVQSEIVPEGQYALRGNKELYSDGTSSIMRSDFSLSQNGATLQLFARLGPVLNGSERANKIEFLSRDGPNSEYNTIMIVDQKDRPNSEGARIGNGNTPDSNLDSVRRIDFQGINFSDGEVENILIDGSVVATNINFLNECSNVSAVSIKQGHYAQPSDVIVDSIYLVRD